MGCGAGDFSEPGMEWADESDEDEDEEAEDGMQGSHIRLGMRWGVRSEGVMGGLDLEAEFLSDLDIEGVEIEEGEEVDGFEFPVYGGFSADFGPDGEVGGEEFRDFESLG